MMKRCMAELAVAGDTNKVRKVTGRKLKSKLARGQRNRYNFPKIVFASSINESCLVDVAITRGPSVCDN